MKNTNIKIKKKETRANRTHKRVRHENEEALVLLQENKVNKEIKQ